MNNYPLSSIIFMFLFMFFTYFRNLIHFDVYFICFSRLEKDAPSRYYRSRSGGVLFLKKLSERYYFPAPQHFLYFLPLPQGQGSFRPIFSPAKYVFSLWNAFVIS